MGDITSYIWKDKRLTHDKTEKQNETRLIDMDDEQLQMIYSHCKEMLYNTDIQNEGRMIMIDQIAKQIECCNAELALRWFKSLQDDKGNYLYSNENLLADLKAWIRAYPDYNPNEEYELKDFLQVPAEFKKVKINLLMKACLDNLGGFDHSKITHSFIYKLGLYLTQEELKAIDKDLRDAGINPDKIPLQTKIDNHIKVPLGLTNIEIRTNPHGLTEAEFRDMVTMKQRKGYRMCKYSALTSSQLQTLRSKVLNALEARTTWQANKWKEIMSQIEEVATAKNIKLN